MQMSRLPPLFLTTLAMLAFAANSVVCRFAIKQSGISPGAFTSIRLLSGALALMLLLRMTRKRSQGNGSWPAAFALFVYAAAFSYSYTILPAGTGALLLFGAVQVTMISWGIWKGEHLNRRQIFGIFISLGGLIILELPGYHPSSLAGSALMLISGIAWGIYSILGKNSTDPIGETAGNFVRSAPLAVILLGITYPWPHPGNTGIALAVFSGAIASAFGYVVWYATLKYLSSTSASITQLSVPILAALGGIALLSEPITSNLIVALILAPGGLYLVLAKGNNSLKLFRASTSINDKEIVVEWTPTAEVELHNRNTPLIVELELYFSCLVKKFVHFHDTPDGRELFPVNENILLFFRPVTSTACAIEDAMILGRQPETELTSSAVRKITPRYVRIDFKNGIWVGEFKMSFDVIHV